MSDAALLRNLVHALAYVEEYWAMIGAFNTRNRPPYSQHVLDNAWGIRRAPCPAKQGRVLGMDDDAALLRMLAYALSYVEEDCHFFERMVYEDPPVYSDRTLYNAWEDARYIEQRRKAHALRYA